MAEEFPAASEPLRFAAGLLRAQEKLPPLRELGAVARGVLPVLKFVASNGPQLLAEDAREALRGGFDDRLREYWIAGEPDWLARTVLAPFARGLRENKIAVERGKGPCSFCGGRPWVASRRAASGTDGASRMLHCALCAFSWQVPRIRCPRCDEADPEKLPTYSAPPYPAARIEACETCHGYVKSIDLTLDARAIPEVDDLASVALDLWADEHGFARLEAGLAGF